MTELKKVKTKTLKDIRKEIENMWNKSFDDLHQIKKDSILGPEENYPYYILNKQQDIKSKFKRIGRTKSLDTSTIPKEEKKKK